MAKTVDTTNPERKAWQDMTDAEKGALLLAHHRGEVLQRFTYGEWREVFPHPIWTDGTAYRTKPKPKRKTVTLGGSYQKSMGWIFGFTHPQGITYKITFDTIDGVPDPDSIRMTPLE